MANTLNLGNGNWATKEDSLLAYNSENGNYKPLPFDFTRASSATVVNKAGLIETVGSGEPRIDFSNDAKGALLLEPQRSNLILYSEDFSNVAWSKSNATPTISSELSPTGALNAYDVVFASGGGYLLESVTTTKTIGSSETISVFSKTDVSGTFLKYGGGTASGTDLENKESFGNGWYRYSVTRTFTEAETASTQIIISSAEVGLNVVLFGAQLEQESYATSYIPTQGSAVTRSADNAYQQNVTQVIGQSEGTMFIEFTPKDSSTLQILYQAKSSSGVVGQVDIRLQGGLIRTLANDGGGSQFFMNGGSYTVGTKYKVAVRYKLNDSKLYINGTDTASDTTCSFTGSSLDQVSFADSLSSFLPSVDIVDARLYNTALTNAELQALTK